MTSIYDSFYNEIKIPANLHKFIYDYGHSQFVECNFELAKNVSSKIKQDLVKNNRIMPCIVDFAQLLESMGMHYWLTSGTLLGWYRECGIIPFTTDIDFSMSIDKYDERLKDKIRFGHPKLYLWLQLGRKKNSLEFRIGGCSFTYDLFFLYKLSEQKYCSYYHADSIVP